MAGHQPELGCLASASFWHLPAAKGLVQPLAGCKFMRKRSFGLLGLVGLTRPDSLISL